MSSGSGSTACAISSAASSVIDEVLGVGLIGIMMCEPGVPGSIIHGSPCPSSAFSRWLTVETPICSGVALGCDHTHRFWMRSRLS